MSQAGTLRRTARWVRRLPVVNRPLTTTVRGLLRATGGDAHRVMWRLPRLGVVTAHVPGGKTLRMLSYADDAGIGNTVFWFGWEGYEPGTSTVLWKLATDARVILDVGAYVGFDALLLALANPSAQVIAFEPHPTARARLAVNLGLNPAVRNVEVVDAALSDRTGRAELLAATAEMPSISSLAGDAMAVLAKAAALTRFDVLVARGDELLAERGVRGVDLVKVDTEGTEPQVLGGLRATLERDLPTIVCEVLDRLDTGAALERVLSPMGYTAHLLHPEGIRTPPHVKGIPEAPNWLFVPARRRARVAQLLGVDL